MMTRTNPFTKEYYTGRKDQFDIDHAMLWKAIEETETREDLIKRLEERFNNVITKLVNKRAEELIEEMQLF